MRWVTMKPIVFCALCLAVGCVKELPPAATPDRVVPTIAANTSPPAAGTGRIVIDVVDGPTQVHRVNMDAQPLDNGTDHPTYAFNESYAVLCDPSPCVVDLTPGNVLLGFPVIGNRNALEVELVHIGTEPSVYRRALSRSGGGGAGYVLGIIGTTFGGISVVTGTALLPIGLAKDSTGMTTAGAITLGVGAVLTTISILAMVADPPEYQSGASLHFPISATTTATP